MASEAQKFWISYLTLKENVYQAVPRDTMRSGFFQAGIKDQLRPPKFADAMLEILSKDDHAAVLDVSETGTITFCLSGDPKYPLTYTACRVQQSNAE